MMVVHMSRYDSTSDKTAGKLRGYRARPRVGGHPGQIKALDRGQPSGNAPVEDRLNQIAGVGSLSYHFLIAKAVARSGHEQDK